jgi:hypothetical protein
MEGVPQVPEVPAKKKRKNQALKENIKLLTFVLVFLGFAFFNA